MEEKLICNICEEDFYDTDMGLILCDICDTAICEDDYSNKFDCCIHCEIDFPEKFDEDHDGIYFCEFCNKEGWMGLKVCRVHYHEAVDLLRK